MQFTIDFGYIQSITNLLILVLLLSRSGSSHIKCIEKERQALIQFKEGLKDDHGVLSSWQSDNCCEWEGVLCSNYTNHVIALDLSFPNLNLPYKLRGKLHPSLLELQDLAYLDLSFFNGYGSTIPKFLGSISTLESLTLAYCDFVGVVPDELGNLSNLQNLDLYYNENLHAKNLEWLSHLSLLRHLDLSGVNLSKVFDLPQAINRLPFLTEVRLDDCGLPGINTASFPLFNSSASLSVLALSSNNFGIQLSRWYWLYNISTLSIINLSDNGLLGPIPNSICNLSSLSILDLSYNLLNGTIPSCFWKLPKLESLSMQSNQFQGALRDFFPSLPLMWLDLSCNGLNGPIPPSMGNLTELQFLDFHSNNFTGLVSEVHLENLSKLFILDLSNNSLIVEFNSDWVPPFSLTVIGLANCKIGPHFPSWLRNQESLVEIDISGSGIHDAIPNWFVNISSQLMTLNLSNNYIHGILPDLMFDRCYVLDLSSNNIEGPIPKLPADITILDLSNNKFQGSIISLCNNSGFLGQVDLFENLLSGNLPDCLVEFKQLFHFNLGNNNFSGPIPSSIGLLSQIQSLHLRNNSLDGELPTSLQKCEQLRVIDIGQNKFTGEIPAWLGGSLPNVIILSLRSNQFKGSIPSEICYLKMIQVLDLSNNNISGMVPNCIRNFTALAQKGSANSRVELTNYSMQVNGSSMVVGPYADSAWLVWKGIELEFGNTLGLVKNIDLSSNKLTGEIPPEITFLEGLDALNISRNNLQGKIPPEIGHLRCLQFLDLSRNQLSGPIPSSLSQLNAIGVLDLSNNNLSGRIPTSTQLQSFNASAYSGNSGLCGPPLPDICPEDQRNLARGSNQDSQAQDDEMLINQSFYAALGIGFAVGLWGTLGSLLLKRSWRVAYFRWVANIQDSLYVTIAVNKATGKSLLQK